MILSVEQTMISYGLLFILILIFSFVGWIIKTSNGFKKSLIKIDEALSGIDVALTKRYDLLTQLVDVVSSYTKYEKDTLMKVVELRNNSTIEEKSELNKEINESFNKISVVMESYPELKSIETVKVLQKAIIESEEHLQAARRMYNANVSYYNESIMVFPSNIIANNQGLKEKEFFKAEETKKETVNVKI
jgi:LemA protein